MYGHENPSIRNWIDGALICPLRLMHGMIVIGKYYFMNLREKSKAQKLMNY